MWHKFKKDLFSYYSKQKVNGVMGVNGIMRTCHTWLHRDLYRLFFLDFKGLVYIDTVRHLKSSKIV